MRARRFVVSLVTAVLLVTGSVTASGSALAGSTQAAVAGCSDQFLNGDIRLGPAQLADQGPIGVIDHGYDRFAGLTAQQFLDQFWDPAAGGGKGGWRFPPANGFQLNAAGQPIEYVLPLGVGQVLDRFGSEFGAFLAPYETPFAQRALPPMSLDNFDPAYTCNYHVYKVLKSFDVESGPIAPGFGQIGHGRQYQLVGSLLPGNPARANVKWLLDNGYLQRAN